MFMLKLDGLTIKLTYEGGKLVEAATRGDGDVGEIVTHNTRAIGGIPREYPNNEDRLVVTGEAFIRPSDFEQLKTTLVDSDGKPYKNGRNLAAGSVRLFDAGTCLGRRLMFIAVQCAGGHGGIASQVGAPQGAAAAGLSALQVHGHQTPFDAEGNRGRYPSAKGVCGGR